MDPVAGPVAEFAQELRQLRRAAGNPPYRALTAATHYSHSALAEAARGTRLPTLAITRAFVRACGGDEQAWAHRWAEVADQLQHNESAVRGPAPACIGPAAAATFTERAPRTDHDSPAAPRPVPPTSTPVPGRGRWRWQVLVAAAAARALATASVGRGPPAPAASAATTAAAHPGAPARGMTSPRRALLIGVGLASITIGVGGLLVMGVTTAPTPQATTPTSPVDDVDPIQGGCITGSVTIQHRSVTVPGSPDVGELQLHRGGTRCNAGWARFVPNPNLPPETLITVQIRRPSDDKTLSFAYRNDGQPVYGNVLRLDRDCVTASVFLGEMRMLLASESTECLR